MSMDSIKFEHGEYSIIDNSICVDYTSYYPMVPKGIKIDYEKIEEDNTMFQLVRFNEPLDGKWMGYYYAPIKL